MTCHQIAGSLMSRSASTWLWLGSGTNTFAVGGLPMYPRAARTGAKSTLEACMVQVPGFFPGSGHWEKTLGLALKASGSAPKKPINALPKAGPQIVPSTTPLQEIASLGFWSLSTENMGTRTKIGAVVLEAFPVCPGGLMVGSIPAWQMGTWNSAGSAWAFFLLKSKSSFGWSTQSKAWV